MQFSSDAKQSDGRITRFTRSIVYKGWLTGDEIWILVDFEKILRDGDYFYK